MASLQETYAPKNACFGCGPANPKGLQIKSIVAGDSVVATWNPEQYHEAFPGVVSGGIIGTLLDCHCNWMAAYAFLRARGGGTPPCTVTAEYTITLKRPCPSNGPITMTANAVTIEGDRCVVEGTLEADGKVRATCRGTFVAVSPGHPAYHRW